VSRAKRFASGLREMASNSELIRMLNRMAAGLELQGANPFRANAFARAARSVREMSRAVADVVHEDPDSADKRLAALPDIGSGMARRIVEYVVTGRLAEYDELMAETPEGLFELLNIPGLGPKAVKLMWRELGITSLAELRDQLDSPQLAALPRMGKRSIDNIRKGMAFAERARDRVPLGIARPMAEVLVGELARVPGVRNIDYAGSLRRGRETIGDIDILVACDDPAAVSERFTTLPPVVQVLARGETRSSVRLEVDEVAIQVDLRVVPEAAWGAALLYFTGSKEHNVHLREIAIKRGLRLNEYGLFPGAEERPQDRGITPVAASDEEDLYAALGLPWIPPELREDRGELDGVPAGLIERTDIKAELHAHTTASDGRMTIQELIECARAQGFHTVAVTDHSASSVIANGLDVTRLCRHVEAVRQANGEVEGITVLAGAEVDILPDGALDYSDDVLAELDIVVASPHVSLRQGSRRATERLLRAIRNPFVHILGHPTGRMIGKRQGLSPDMDALSEAAAACDTALEINAQWQRLDLRDYHVRTALEHGCKLAISTDAHGVESFDRLIYGILTARRGGLTADACINAWPASKLHRWLQSKGK
jgi:DNA polymerase (family 10)